MLDLPQNVQQEGTDETPLKLAGDHVEGWELILGSFYRE
jgi:hypothetical protein